MQNTALYLHVMRTPTLISLFFYSCRQIWITVVISAHSVQRHSILFATTLQDYTQLIQGLLFIVKLGIIDLVQKAG